MRQATNLVYAHLLELRGLSTFDADGRKELDKDLAAKPGKPRSKGTKNLLAMMGAAPPRQVK